VCCAQNVGMLCTKRRCVVHKTSVCCAQNVGMLCTKRRYVVHKSRCVVHKSQYVVHKTSVCCAQNTFFPPKFFSKHILIRKNVKSYPRDISHISKQSIGLQTSVVSAVFLTVTCTAVRSAFLHFYVPLRQTAFFNTWRFLLPAKN